MCNITETNKKLISDWNTLKYNYPTLPQFDEATRLSGCQNDIIPYMYTLSLERGLFVLRTEEDFGKKYTKSFKTFDELELYLFNAPIERMINKLLEKYLQNYNLYIVIRNNMKFAIWNTISPNLANQMIDTYTFSLRVSITQLLLEYPPIDNNQEVYSFCDDSEYAFIIKKENGIYTVVYNDYQYQVNFLC